MLKVKTKFNIILLVFFLATVIIIGFLLFYSTDKQNYVKYKKTEVKINSKLSKYLSSEDTIEKTYYANKLDKGEAVKRIKKVAVDLENLYDSFNFNKGDIYTKELCATKKEIIIDYSEVYMNRAESIARGIKPDNTGDTTYITNLIARYAALDQVLKSKYKLSFGS